MGCSWNARVFLQMRHHGLCMKSVLRAEDYTKKLRTVGYYCENTAYRYPESSYFSIEQFEFVQVKREII